MSDGKPSVQEEKEDPHKIATSMTLADISIRNHVFAWILMFALIGFGLLTFTGFGTVFRGLGISQNPDVDFPVVNVSITWEGASPEIMETDVVDILEETVTSVEGVKEVTSTSRQGTANITIELELERDIDVAMQDVQSKISQAMNRLPSRSNYSNVFEKMHEAVPSDLALPSSNKSANSIRSPFTIRLKPAGTKSK